MKKIVAFVPVKLNNERLPGKNTKSFDGGKPLIEYILGTLKSVDEIEDIYVYCSNPAIQDFLPEGVKYLKRDKSLDSSKTLITEVLQSFANDVEAETYVLAHATAPFLSKESIEKGINAVTKSGYDSATTVTKCHDFLWKDGKPFNYDVKKIPRTQDLDEMHVETTGLYVYGRNLILKEGRRIGDNPYMIEVSREEAIDINEPFDFMVANAWFQYKNNR
ncbi:MAG: acylneuraminate cytidylyltransferase family protein [Lachnospiraceae bacterium]|nr:acylneuraminate cytidylyltransferase family protein [Lachnospiraceae bacterium]